MEGNSPIISYNLICSTSLRDRPDKVIVEFGRNRREKIKYTYTSRKLGREKFNLLVHYLEAGDGATRFLLFNVDPGTMGGAGPRPKTARHTRRVIRRK